MIMAEGRIRTRWLYWNFPDPGVPCFTSFPEKWILSLWTASLVTDASQLELGWRSHLQNVETHSPSLPRRKKKTISVVKFHVPFNFQQSFGLCCFYSVDEFILWLFPFLNFKRHVSSWKNKGRETTCKLSQEKPLLKARSLLTDGRIQLS